MTTKRSVLLITQFGESTGDELKRLIVKALAQVPHALRHELGSLEPILATDRHTQASPAQIRQLIADSPFVVACVTPVDLKLAAGGSRRTWSANVFYELAIAQALGIPIFALCKSGLAINGRVESFPFDGLELFIHDWPSDEAAIKRFRSWLRRALPQILRHRKLGVFDSAVLDVRSTVGKWTHGYWEGFALLEAYGARLRRVIRDVEEYYEHTRKLSVDMRRGSGFLVGKVFIAAVNALDAGDSYDTVSAMSFWQGLESGHCGHAFLVANEDALSRRVEIRRLFVCRDSGGDPGGVWSRHKALSAKYPNYRVARVPLSEVIRFLIDNGRLSVAINRPRELPIHCALFHYAEKTSVTGLSDRKDVILRPHYEKFEGEDVAFSSLEIKDGAGDERAQFDELWMHFVTRAPSKPKTGSESASQTPKPKQNPQAAIFTLKPKKGPKVANSTPKPKKGLEPANPTPKRKKGPKGRA